jgi:hypothetical protein
MIPSGKATIKPEPVIKIKEDFPRKISTKIFILLTVLEAEAIEAEPKIWTFKTSLKTYLEDLSMDRAKAPRKKLISDKICR